MRPDTDPRPKAPLVVPMAALLLVAGCVLLSRDPVVTELDSGRPTRVESPAKVHLADGSMVVYSQGFTLDRDTIIGQGTRYGLTLAGQGGVSRLPVDSVVAMESYRAETNTGRTVGYSLALSGAIVGGAIALCYALCGSCPTIYSADGGLEAEAFSYSIAPIFEARDVDRLATRAGPDGTLRLDVRNEMLETHYLNRFELIEAVHEPDERVAVDPLGRAIAFRVFDRPVRAVDREGRDLSAVVAAIDGDATRSSDRSLADPEAGFDDWIDVAAAAPAGADSVALLLHLRNSPLSTILLYDVMLGGQGPGAVDWLGRDLGRVAEALDLGTWYVSRMGLRITVPDGGPPGRVGDVGPIAWKEIAVVVPVTGDSVKARLSFVADAWRIDRIALGAAPRRPPTRAIPPAAVAGADGVSDAEALDRLREADDRYVETRPGERFEIAFDAGAAQEGDRTFLLASTGYYVEWIRGGWLDLPPSSFDPSDAALVEALRRWRDARPTYEVAFQRTRFPVEENR